MKVLGPLLLLAATLAGPLAAAQTSLAPETEKCLALRAKYGVETPASEDRVLAYSEAEHHTAQAYCAVAWRDADGRWTVSGTGEESSGLLRIPTAQIPETKRVMTPSEGLQMDRLLASRALYRQGSPKDGELGVGAMFHTIEIVSPHGHQVIRWTGRLKGKAGQVADLVMGRA